MVMQMQSCWATGQRPRRNRRSARRANPAGNKSAERIDGDRKSRGRRRGERVEGCNNDHRETETDFPSSTWEILPVSLQPARTVTHDYSPLPLLLIVHTHADTHSDRLSGSQLPPRSLLKTLITHTASVRGRGRGQQLQWQPKKN